MNNYEENLWRELRNRHCLTSAQKECNEEPNCLELMGNKLYYDEGNESIKVINGLNGCEWFWSELNENEKMQLIDAYQDTKKKAYLVTLSPMVRVIVKEDATEEEIIQAAVSKMLKDPSEYLHSTHCDDVREDVECPFDPKTDNK